MKSGLKNLVLSLFIGVLTVAGVLTFGKMSVYGASASISLTGADGNVGDTVAVTMTINAEGSANAQVDVTYDTNYLEYISASDSGAVKGNTSGVVSFDIKGLTNAYATLINFKLKKEGTAGVSIASNATVKTVDTGELMDCTMSGTTFNIGAAPAASNDSTLSGLLVQAVTSNGDNANVSYTPNFSPDVHEYTCELGANTTRLVIATTLSDSKSKTSVSGTKINAGSNMTTITVTAEDGTSTVYTLYSTRLTDETTASAEGETAATTATVTDFDRSPKMIDSLGKYLIQDFSMTTIPEGFEEGTATYNGETIAVLKGTAKPLTIVCIADDAQGTNLTKYIYNEATGAFNVMVDVTSMQRMYTIIPTDDTYKGPEGYIQTAIELNGQVCVAWIKEEGSQFFVVYAMNWNGETGLYVYDNNEQTMQRFIDGNKSTDFSDEPDEQGSEYQALRKQYNELKKSYDELAAKNTAKKRILVGIAGLVVLCIIFILYKIYKKNNDGNSDKHGKINTALLDNDEEDDDTEELDITEVENKMSDASEIQIADGALENSKEDLTEAPKENNGNYKENNKTEDNAPVKENKADDILDALSTVNLSDVVKEVKKLDDEDNKNDDFAKENTIVITEDEIANSKNTSKNSNESPKQDKKQPEEMQLVDLEADEPFEIEFVDMDK